PTRNPRLRFRLNMHYCPPKGRSETGSGVCRQNTLSTTGPKVVSHRKGAGMKTERGPEPNHVLIEIAHRRQGSPRQGVAATPSVAASDTATRSAVPKGISPTTVTM